MVSWAGAWVVIAVAGFCGVSGIAGGEEAPGSMRVKGLLVPVQQARIASRSQGLIAFIRDEGEKVRMGEPLLELEDAMEKLQLEQQERLLDLRSFEAQSSSDLSAKDVISRTEAEEKRIAHEIAKVQVGQAREMLKRRKVEAPFDGVVTEKLREVGEAVDEFTPVLNLANVSRLYFETFLPASLRTRIREGETVRIVVEGAPPGEAVSGTIEILAGVVNAASGEFKLRVMVPNEDGKLVAGVQASADLPLGVEAVESPPGRTPEVPGADAPPAAPAAPQAEAAR
jgi:membrane fusion protein, multidrug efflux system